MKEPDSDSLFRFIKTFVIHLTAKRVLERHAFKTRDQPVTITLFTADRSLLRIPAGSWKTMEGIIRASFPPHPSSTPGDTNAATKAIETLQNIIRNPPSNPSRRSQKLLVYFRQILQGHGIIFRAGMHCETLLATLKKFHDLSNNGPGDEEFTSTCKVLFFTYLPARSHHLSLVIAKIRYALCVQTMLSCMLEAIGDLVRRPTTTTSSWLPYYDFSY